MDYDELISKLEPEAIEAKINAPIERADVEAKYRVQKAYPGKIENFEDTTRRIALYTSVLHSEYGLRLPEEYMISHALKALQTKSLATVHDDVKGSESRLHLHFDKIKRHLINDQTNIYLTSVFESVNEYDYDLMESICTEYIRRFGRFLPFELRSVPTMMLNWRQIFKMHAQVLSDLKKDVGSN